MADPTKKIPTESEIQAAKKWSIWEKDASTFDWHYDSEETFYVLEGDVTVTWKGGEISFTKGDLVTFPEGLDCTWHVKKKIRKHYNFK
ncbi:MAG: cupin domain-containing protein [Candidatus Lokiarchaeota archaeon]|nr:cupin domain-containing protein [Candidatus Lokiarchaeota archaeon]